MLKVLIVEDNKDWRMTLAEALNEDGFEITSVDTGEKALEVIEELHPNVILLDIILPGMDGLEILKIIKRNHTEIIVIIMTAYGEIHQAVEAIKLGAYDYITKPIPISMIRSKLKKVTETLHLKEEVQYFMEEKQAQYSLRNIIGISKAIEDVFSLIKRIATSKTTTVLIHGESGTGKELIANAIHFNSVTGDKPFLDINCAAIPKELLEAELFGFEKGVFTDAKEEKRGLLEVCQGGSLFLDEIAEMSLTMQAKLLRVIETRKFRRIGGLKNYEVTSRIMTATNKDLEQYIKLGKFREDLYYRLKVVPIYIPPLRDRREDIIPTTNYYLGFFSRELKQPLKSLNDDTMELFYNYDWPGNVRELKNVVERLCLLVPRLEFCPEDLPEEIRRNSEKKVAIKFPAFSKQEQEEPEEVLSLEELEKVQIIKVLEKTKWNKSLAAKLLKVSRPTLRKKIEQYNIIDQRKLITS